jgi:BA14K-like protein
MGVAAGFVAGAIIGGALASPYYGYDPYYDPAPYPYYAPPPGPVYYGAPGPAYGAPPPGDAVAYCRQRFRSYDPASGTYLGYDGLRHPCP